MTSIEINELGLIAKLYLNNAGNKKKPGIILLSGSDGGMPGENAIPLSFIETLVANDFAVMALAYFGIYNLPPNLENIELEYFEKALAWLQSQPNIDKNNIAVIGQSRGGELALILGTIFNQFQAIIAFAPSNKVTGGFPHPNKPAWQYKSKAIHPFIGGLTSQDENLTELDDLKKATLQNIIPKHQNFEYDPYNISDIFKARNAMSNATKCQIKVEKITCPILLFSGGQDAIWPSQYYCEAIVKRLKQHEYAYTYEHINYKYAGHGLIASFDAPIYHPVGNFWCKLGGTVEGNKIANLKAVQKTLNFLSILHLPLKS